MKRVVDVHQTPLTRIWVCITFTPVPVGTQVAWLLRSSTGTPSALTLLAALIHEAVAQGSAPGVIEGREHPVILYRADCVTTARPDTVTRMLNDVGLAWPGG
jgi:hypothetical protein